MVFHGSVVRPCFPNEVFGAKVGRVMGAVSKRGGGALHHLRTHDPSIPEVLSGQLHQLACD